MRDNTVEAFGAGLMIGVFFGLAIGGLVGSNGATNSVHKTAIEKNVAEWRIDSKTGDREFVWLSPIKGEK